MLARCEHRRRAAHRFIGAISADRTECRIDRQNPALGIGHHHAVAGRFKGQPRQTQSAQARGIAQTFDHRVTEQMRVYRLEHIAIHPDLDGHSQMARIRRSADHDDLRIGVFRTDGLTHGQSVHHRHHDVGNYQIGLPGSPHRQPFTAVAAEAHFTRQRGDDRLHQLA